MSTPPKRVRKPPKKLVKEVNEPDDFVIGPMVATSHHNQPMVATPSPTKPSPPKKQKKDKPIPEPLPEPPMQMPGVVAKAKKVAGVPVAPPPPAPVIQDMQELMLGHLRNISGQGQENVAHIIDHNYCRPWNRHPDPAMKCRPAKYLFMKNFPKNVIRTPPIVSKPIGAHVQAILEREEVDIMTVDPLPDDPLIREAEKVINMTPISAICTGYHDKPPPSKIGWTPTMHKLYNKSVRILHSHRLKSLAMVGQYNEVLQERSLSEQTAARFRYLFAGTAFWDANLLNWLRATLQEYVCGSYFNVYHECMQHLRTKVPTLVDKFYPPAKKILKPDPINIVLNNYRPKRIQQSPLFIIIPNGPQSGHYSAHFTSARMKHWHSIFGSLGKVITLPCVTKVRSRVTDTLRDIRISVRDQIRECKKKFYDHRPLILVGFGESSLIAAHCSLDHPKDIAVVICLGFPLTAINGFRGDLDDPLLEISVPTLLVIGSNSSKCALDDVEDFRERITKAETGLIVVGGCNDRLIVGEAKKKWNGLNQTIVDRCLAEEISDFISTVQSAKVASSPSPGASSSIQN